MLLQVNNAVVTCLDRETLVRGDRRARCGRDPVRSRGARPGRPAGGGFKVLGIARARAARPSFALGGDVAAAGKPSRVDRRHRCARC